MCGCVEIICKVPERVHMQKCRHEKKKKMLHYIKSPKLAQIATGQGHVKVSKCHNTPSKTHVTDHLTIIRRS